MKYFNIKTAIGLIMLIALVTALFDKYKTIGLGLILSIHLLYIHKSKTNN